MKYLEQNWDRKYDGVLYFIHRLEEMLFHYSDDIVKAPVHNTVTLIHEYLFLESDNAIKAFHLNTVADEVSDSIKKDSIAKGMLGNDNVENLIKSIKSHQKETMHYLYGQLNLSKYYENTVSYILEHIPNSKDKNEIREVLRIWIAATINRGYSAEYIYRYLHSLFGQPVEEPIEMIKKFIDHFNFEKSKYKIYFLFLSANLEYKELLEKRLGICFDDDGHFDKLKKKNNKSFIGRVEVEAIDPYSAVRRASEKLDIFISFYRVISNRKRQLLGKHAKVLNITTNEELIIPISSSGYRIIEVEPKLNLKEAIDGAVLGCQSKPLETYASLNKIINLHNMALRQLDLNDGFVNLWSVLEVVSKDANIESKIEKVIQSILPILQNNFYIKYFETLQDDLKRNLNREEYLNLLKSIRQNGTNSLKIAYFCLLPEYETKREEYFNKLEKFPNIRNKIYKIYRLRNDKSKLYKMSEDYAQRLKWHLYRLYRVRNAIVHAGETNKHIQVLGEHLHIYCDGIIMEIIHKLALNDCFINIQDVLVDTRLLVERKK